MSTESKRETPVRRQKHPADSRVEMTELVLPNDTNLLGNLLGGRLLHWMDIAGAMAAQRHCNSIVATAAIDSVEFNQPVHVGDIVRLQASVTWVGRTSMEVRVDVYAEDYRQDERRFTNKAYLTFVAIGENGRPTLVPDLIPQTQDETAEAEAALKRRAIRLGTKTN